MKCPSCQSDNAQSMKFCGQCGCDLRGGGAEKTPARAYGGPRSYTPKFLADKILANKSAIEGERKQVTVLFADVANFTAMSELLDPEQMHGIMDGCFAILMDEIHDRDGTINQFVGDGVMALFGAPLAREDHAQRACLSALAIQKALEKFGERIAEEFGVVFKMRLGINSGTVVVGAIGDDLRMDYTAVGDTTNLAARMESMARPGTILVSADTFKIVRKFFRLKSLGKLEMKGKRKPVEAYELLRHIIHRPRLGMERKIYSDLVGRHEELGILELKVAKAKDGKGSIVNIVGEAGIGKSRLVAELKRQEVMSGMKLLEGRAISIGRNLSFHPFIDLFKQWAAVKEDDKEIVAFEKLEAAVEKTWPENVREVFPFLATLMGIKLSGNYADRVEGIEGDSLEKLIFKNVRDLLEKNAELSPLTIVMEDLHWADDSSVALLESLFRLAATEKILFINVFRPGYQDRGDRIAGTLREKHADKFVEIVLQPLDKKASQSLVENMLRTWNIPSPLMDRIVARSGGNPFFIEEVVRSLIDEGAIVVKNQSFEATEKIEDVVIPHSINDVLAARIDRLEEKTRNLVKVASVIGRSFFYRILSDVVEAIDDLDRRLAYLKDIQLIRERRRMDELEYLFKHALAQEAAYGSLLLGKRKKLHLKVAGAIEKVFEERLHEFYGMLAYHYGRGEDEEKAQQYLIKAGEEALRSSASSEALHYYREALNLYLKMYGTGAAPERVASIEKNIALALYYRGRYTESLSYIDKVLGFHGFSEPKNIVSKTANFLSGFCHLFLALYIPSLKWRKKPSEHEGDVVNLLTMKTEMYSHTDPDKFLLCFSSEAKFLTRFDLSMVKEGKKSFALFAPCLTWPCISFKLGARVIESLQGSIDEADTKALMCHRFARTMMSALRGGFEFGSEHYDGPLVESALEIGEFFVVSSYLVFCAWIEIERGCFDRAKMFSDMLLEIADTYDNEYARSINYEVSIRNCLKSRKLADAMAEAEEGIPIMSKVEFHGLLAFMYGHKAQTQVLLGDMKGAEKSLNLATEYEKKAGMLPPMWLSSVVLGHFVFCLRRMEEAVTSGEGAEISVWRKKALKSGKREMKIVRKLAQDRTAAYRHMGVYCWLTGNKKKAALWWARSMKEGERLNALVPLSRTYFEVGKRLAEPGNDREAINGFQAGQYLAKAETMFITMNLEWDRNELENLRT